MVTRVQTEADSTVSVSLFVAVSCIICRVCGRIIFNSVQMLINPNINIVISCSINDRYGRRSGVASRDGAAKW